VWYMRVLTYTLLLMPLYACSQDGFFSKEKDNNVTSTMHPWSCFWLMAKIFSISPTLFLAYSRWLVFFFPFQTAKARFFFCNSEDLDSSWCPLVTFYNSSQLFIYLTTFYTFLHLVILIYIFLYVFIFVF